MIRAESLNSSVSPRMLYVHITGHLTSLVSPRKSHNRPLPGQRHREHKCHVSCCTDAELPGSLWHLSGSKPGGISRTVFQIPAYPGDFPWSLPNLIHIHQHRTNHIGVTPFLNAAPLLGQKWGGVEPTSVVIWAQHSLKHVHYQYKRGPIMRPINFNVSLRGGWINTGSAGAMKDNVYGGIFSRKFYICK